MAATTVPTVPTMASRTRVDRTFHAALDHVFGTRRRPHQPCCVAIRYDGYAVGTLAWCPDDARYRCTLYDARVDGVFAMDGPPERTVAYVLILRGHVDMVFDRDGRSLEWGAWHDGPRRPFYRDGGF